MQDVRISATTDVLKVLAERGQLAPVSPDVLAARAAGGVPWYKNTMVLVLGGVVLLGGAFLMTRKKKKGRR
jgi:LPXTG-motif cell wall-anchored protein